MPSVLCPRVVGRRGELDRLLARLSDAASGRGGVVAVRGEAGLGKSRLARAVVEHAADAGALVLTGRAVPGTSPTPYRPLSEAFLAVSRRGIRPAGADLLGFAAAIGRLVPDWRVDGAVGSEESPLVVGEAVVRLARALAPSAGCVFVLEDLHWSDAETAAVVEHLIDALAGERVLCLATMRSEPSTAADVFERGRARGAVEMVDLAPLPPDAQRRMVSACLETDVLPPGLADFVQAHADGVPFLVEELLAGLVAGGALRRDDLGWQLEGALIPSVPATLRESVRARLDALPAGARSVLGAAAVLGRRFDWSLVPGVASQDAGAVNDALRAALTSQLIVVDGQEFRFRHALTREIVLAELLPIERAEFAARALRAVTLAYPELPGTWCALAAELAETAGESQRAAALLTEVARRATGREAFASAETAGRRALDLCEPDSAEAVDAAEALVTALAASGKVREAMAAGTDLLRTMGRDGSAPRRQAELRMLLARAAIDAAETETAEQLLRDIRTSAEGDEALTARLDALAATFLADSDNDGARRLAQSALERADRLSLPETECEALYVLGRTTWRTDRAAAHEFAERAVEVARQNGLGVWRARALQQLALLRSITRGRDALTVLRPAMVETGAFNVVAQLDLLSADMTFGELQPDACEEAARNCVDISRRFGLATLSVGLLWLAGAHALRLDEAAMTDTLAEAIAVDPSDERIIADAWGRVRATYHALREERDELIAALDEGMVHVAKAPAGRSIYGGRVLHATLHAMTDGDFGAAARDALAGSPIAALPYGAIALAGIEGISLGRTGRRERASQLFADARAAVADAPMGFHVYHLSFRYMAEAAVRDGWGDPVPLLRELDAYFSGKGYDRVARACRALITEAGAPAPRRGRGDSVVPIPLRSLGVTSREFDVLQLVAAGRSNREIAEQLVLSVRTVENHVASLLRRTGATTRTGLAAFAAK